eukprot:m.207225 g.207225  ORF g.207225 m.207225 type:complete len:188 (+) comp26072_c0_seq31:360-923(+)
MEKYSTAMKDPVFEPDRSVEARFQRLRTEFESQGMRKSVDAVMVVTQHGFPHVLLLQLGAFFKLPGGELKPDESDQEGLDRILNELFDSHDEPSGAKWPAHAVISQWWRPNFDAVQFPYIPPHVTKPKEHKKLYLINLPSSRRFIVPKNYRLVPVPMFELYDNKESYGQILSTVPQMLSRFEFNKET